MKYATAPSADISDTARPITDVDRRKTRRDSESVEALCHVLVGALNPYFSAIFLCLELKADQIT